MTYLRISDEVEISVIPLASEFSMSTTIIGFKTRLAIVAASWLGRRRRSKSTDVDLFALELGALEPGAAGVVTAG